MVLAAAGLPTAVQADSVVHVYNWSDYIAEDTLANFTAATGIKVVYDVYDANETLEAKLFAGQSGYDVVFPTVSPFAARHVKAGLYQPVDKAALGNIKHLDPVLMDTLTAKDPANAHLVPYMWGTTALGMNLVAVRKRLGADVDLADWKLLFDPATVSKLADCGVAVLDDQQEVLGAALLYLGKPVSSMVKADLDAAAKTINAIRPHLRYFHSSQYINDLANGDLCLALGYSGDVLQARDRAAEAENGVEIAYRIPKQGAILWVDVMAVPKDAPHPKAAHAFINYMLQPEVIAGVSNYVAYANANKDATPLLEDGIRNDPGIYPPAEVMQRLVTTETLGDKDQRVRTRLWNSIKTGR